MVAPSTTWEPQMNRTIKLDFDLLNKARARIDLPPLKSWKESHAKLREAIDRINARVIERCVKLVPPTDPALIRERKRREKINAVAARILAGETDARPEREPVLVLPDKPKPAPRPRVRIEGTATLADIARELGISPKIARAKMRKKKIDFEVAQYVYPIDRVDDVKSILRHR